MMRRIDAKISSMEGSWTFAGCVISDSTSATPSRALFYTRHDRGRRFAMRKPSISSRRARTCPKVRALHDDIHAGPVPRSGVQHASRRAAVDTHESFSFFDKGYVMASRDCKQSP
jgi:hypothetical protein